MLLQCLIEREGDTTVTRGGQNYTFRQNKNGHAICEVQNDDHARIFLRMGASVYRPYGAQAEAHARALKMIPKQTVLEESEEDKEVFEESVGIVEGKAGETALAAEGGQQEIFPEMESAEEAVAELPQDELVRSVAIRLLGKGTKKVEVVKQLQKQFDLSLEDANRTVNEVAKK